MAIDIKSLAFASIKHLDYFEFLYHVDHHYPLVKCDVFDGSLQILVRPMRLECLASSQFL